MGDEITFTIKVENTGNVTLANVTISDPKLGLTCPGITLEPGDSNEDCTGTYRIEQEDLDRGRFENTASAVSDQTPQSVEDTATVFGPRLPVDPEPKFTAEKRVDQANFSAAGEVLDYSFVVTNTGNAELTGLTIDDKLPLTTGINCPSTAIPVGESVTCTAAYTVTANDVAREFVTNTADIFTEETGEAAVAAEVTIRLSACPVQPVSLNTASLKNAGQGGTAVDVLAEIPAVNPEARGPNLPCDVDDEIVRKDMKSLSHDFLAQRMNMLAANGPRLAWRNNRIGGFGDGSNGFNVAGENGNITGDFAFSSGAVRKALSGQRVTPTADAPPEGAGSLNVWTEGNFAFYGDQREDEDVKGDFFVGYAGIDLAVYHRVNVGIMGEIDWTVEEGDDDGRVSGTGWMVGPYLSAELADGLFLDARAMRGWSSNAIRQISTEVRPGETSFSEYEGDFDTGRWLAEATLTGNHDYRSVTLTPDIRFLYIREEQNSYAVTCVCKVTGVDGQTVQLAQLSGGLRISRLIEMDATMVRPYAAGRLFWNIDNPGELTADGDYISANDLRGAVTVGFDASSDRLQFGAEAAYDGLFADGDYAIGGKLSLGYKF